MLIQEKRKETKNSWLIDYFKGEDVFLVASGASLNGFDFSRLDEKNVIAINHSYSYVKHNILVFLDASFHQGLELKGDSIEKMSCKIITGESSHTEKLDNISLVKMAQVPSSNPDYLFGSRQSGLVALNAALISNAKNIYLLGFDCRFINGLCHFYHHSCNHPKDYKQLRYERAVYDYLYFAHHKNIFNCSKNSLITAFDYKDIEEALK